jgi:hypothetical protein
MIRFYSKRLLLPYVGVVQVVELGWARALSLDGKNWAIRYARDENKQTQNWPLSHDPRVIVSLMVNIEEDMPKIRGRNHSMDPEILHADSQRFFEAMRNARLPFEAADRYEYWLLDGSDKSPLALLHSCVYEEEMKRHVPPPEWMAIAAAELPVQDPVPPDDSFYKPPVNYRLQEFVEVRAGSKPQAAWFKRTDPATDDFPPCLLSDQWSDPEGQRLCDLYLQRLAPRLLMLHGLPRAVRQGLEQTARDYVFDVERFYPLYPEVVDDSPLDAARVEARLRHANAK